MRKVQPEEASKSLARSIPLADTLPKAEDAMRWEGFTKIK